MIAKPASARGEPFDLKTQGREQEIKE
jgi:hypothetical protein